MFVLVSVREQVPFQGNFYAASAADTMGTPYQLRHAEQCLLVVLELTI